MNGESCSSLSGSVAIISGGLGDIGREIALELGRRGADVAVGDLASVGPAESILSELRTMGRRARYDAADVADAAAVRAWVGSVESDLGTPDIIVPNAAVVTLAGVRDFAPEEWAHELQVNLTGAFHLAQVCAQRLVHQGRPGRIVFIGSWAGHAPHPRIPAYCVAKAGLRMLCKVMALDLAPHGILVNEVAPGYVDAGLSGRMFDCDPALRERAAGQIPVRSLTEPKDVALQVANLCDPANRQMTGSVLLMDGGLSLVTPAGLQDG